MVRDISVVISYTLHHAAHKLIDGSVMSMLAVPPCSFSFARHSPRFKSLSSSTGLRRVGYKAPDQDGHRLPLDAYQLEASW